MAQIIGEIKLFTADFAPQGWAFCNGDTLPIAEYMALFALIGTKYGGNGITNFMLPNLAGVENVGAPAVTNYMIALQES
jgi:microcystin-dependent protein